MVTVHTPLFREVFWHEYAKIPRHTVRIFLISAHDSQVDIPSAVCYTKITYLTKEREI